MKSNKQQEHVKSKVVDENQASETSRSTQGYFRRGSLIDILPPRHSLMASIGDLGFDMSDLLQDGDGDGDGDGDEGDNNNNDGDLEKFNTKTEENNNQDQIDGLILLSQIDSMLQYDAEQPSKNDGDLEKFNTKTEENNNQLLSQIDSMLQYDAEQPSKPAQHFRRESSDEHNLKPPREPLANVRGRQTQLYAKERMLMLRENRTMVLWTLISAVLAVVGIVAIAMGMFGR
eukprot:CAMPEP_0194227060 /NCGR_PEP_ID=MMETSP0156-20130528/42666_1 /TAXON_ID=33649 /ORGANISM="Thalassionema nitzschioides, Strain L26-B" /LENGTH=230 /DNA_ID=CAMNT_0038959533 /DNA_START=107 /DNA_END=799 /DNA_ORIENTATION=+